MCQLHSELTLQSGRLNTSEKEASDLRCQLSTLHETLAKEEASHRQACMVSRDTPCSASPPSHGLRLPSLRSSLLPAASVSHCLSAAFFSEACHGHKPVPAPAICLTVRHSSPYKCTAPFCSFLYVRCSSLYKCTAPFCSFLYVRRSSLYECTA